MRELQMGAFSVALITRFLITVQFPTYQNAWKSYNSVIAVTRKYYKSTRRFYRIKSVSPSERGKKIAQNTVVIVGGIKFFPSSCFVIFQRILLVDFDKSTLSYCRTLFRIINPCKSLTFPVAHLHSPTTYTYSFPKKKHTLTLLPEIEKIIKLNRTIFFSPVNFIAAFSEIWLRISLLSLQRYDYPYLFSQSSI